MKRIGSIAIVFFITILLLSNSSSPDNQTNYPDKKKAIKVHKNICGKWDIYEFLYGSMKLELDPEMNYTLVLNNAYEKQDSVKLIGVLETSLENHSIVMMISHVKDGVWQGNYLEDFRATPIIELMIYEVKKDTMMEIKTNMGSVDVTRVFKKIS
jgi:hypothetical protein